MRRYLISDNLDKSGQPIISVLLIDMMKLVLVVILVVLSVSLATHAIAG